MHYPAAPWTLKGFGFLTLHLIDISKASKLIPMDLEIVSVLPGKTLGGIALGKYETGSTLTYSELIVVAGLVRRNQAVGTWISHIYVDQEQSIAGGREIWGLPKKPAEFYWQPHEQGGVVVKQGDRVLCNLGYGWQFNFWRQSGQFSSYSQLEENLLRFDYGGDANFALMGARLEVPQESPFSDLIDSQPWLALKGEGLKLVIEPPTVVAARQQEPHAGASQASKGSAI